MQEVRNERFNPISTEGRDLAAKPRLLASLEVVNFMSRRKKIILGIVVVILLLIAAFYFWKTVYAPTTTQQTGNPNPTPIATPSPNPSPTTGQLVGKADSKTLHITKILVYDVSGKKLVSTLTVDNNGNFGMELAAGDYMIDYVASPDLYPHSQEQFTINAGQTHEVDFVVE